MQVHNASTVCICVAIAFLCYIDPQSIHRAMLIGNAVYSTSPLSRLRSLAAAQSHHKELLRDCATSPSFFGHHRTGAGSKTGTLSLRSGTGKFSSARVRMPQVENTRSIADFNHVSLACHVQRPIELLDVS